MKQKIVIITSKYLHPFVEKAFEDFKEDCTVTIADYTNFDHITDIYRKYEKTADGFMISGTTAMAAIEHHIGEFQKPVISFHADLISFYHALIKLFLERRDLDPTRCIFDFMLPIVKDPEHPVEATADYLIHEMDLNNLALTMDKWVVWKHDPCAAGIGCDAAGSKKLAERLSDSAGQAMHCAVDSTYGAMEANVNLPLALAAFCADCMDA